METAFLDHVIEVDSGVLIVVHSVPIPALIACLFTTEPDTALGSFPSRGKGYLTAGQENDVKSTVS